MNTGILRSPDKRVWRQLYKAVLFELDANKVSDRIAEAETALVTRARELFHAAGDNIEVWHRSSPISPSFPFSQLPSRGRQTELRRIVTREKVSLKSSKRSGLRSVSRLRSAGLHQSILVPTMDTYFGKDMRHPRRSTSQPSRWLRGIVEMTRRQSRHALRIALGIALATILLGLLAILAVEWMSSPSFLTTTICHRHARNCAPRWMPTEHRVQNLSGFSSGERVINQRTKIP